MTLKATGATEVPPVVEYYRCNRLLGRDFLKFVERYFLVVDSDLLLYGIEKLDVANFFHDTRAIVLVGKNTFA